jgi:hypothetical protein
MKGFKVFSMAEAILVDGDLRDKADKCQRLYRQLRDLSRATDEKAAPALFDSGVLVIFIFF